VRFNRNKVLWEKYEQFARARGRLVVQILSHYIPINGATILDFGCGTGGISLELSAAGAAVSAFDLNEKKMRVFKHAIIKSELDIEILEKMDNHNARYDAIILSDVIEHLIDPLQDLFKLKRMLKPCGLLYVSTPNQYSPLNILVDPHFSLPIISLLQRKHVKSVLADVLKQQPRDRIDFPQLFSLKKLDKLLRSSGFSWHFVNSRVASFAIHHPESVWNRGTHLKIIKILEKTNIASAIEKIVNDDVGFFNMWLNPTWYLVAEKSPA